MIWFIVVAGIVLYFLIGGFLSGACERELSPAWVFFWPVLLLIILACIIAKIPVSYGKRYYIKLDKLLEKLL